MAAKILKTPVKGGSISRNAVTGQVVSVSTGKSVSKSSAKSQNALAQAAGKYGAALKRLADR